MITVHHLNNSRSQRILWLLEELGLEYQIERYQRDPKTMLAPPELKAIHPLGKSPVVTVDGETVAESGAIIEFLLDRFGGGALRPVKKSDVLRYRYWLHYAEGSLMTPLLLKLVFQKIQSDSPLLVRPVAWAIAQGVGKMFIDPNLAIHFDFVEGELAKTPWFAGEAFSGADIQMSFPIEAGESRLDYSNRPNLRRFLERVRSRPAYQRALDRGGPFEL